MHMLKPDVPSSRRRVRAIDVMVVVVIAGLIGWKWINRPVAAAQQVPSSFAKQVDLGPLNRTAVQADGRLRSFESHAKTYMGKISGPRAIRGQSNGFTYLDMLFRPEAYRDLDIIFIKNESVRDRILSALAGDTSVEAGRAAAIRKSGLIAQELLLRPTVVELLEKLGRDLIRTSKVVDAIETALSVADPRFLAENLRIAAASGPETPWLSITRLAAQVMPKDEVHAGLGREATAEVGGELGRQIGQAWNDLRNSWRGEDAAAVNAQIKQVAELFPKLSGSAYPSTERLALESWYFRWKSMTWVWVVYVASVVPLLMSVIYRWDRPRRIGMALFIAAFLAHTASLAIRWYISGRWPNSNMFEALTTSAWLGGAAALILEWLTRRKSVRNLFALSSAVASMAALMAAYFLPAQLDSSINNKMAALNDIWIYIHTNMIILSYALIGLACVPALLQLRHRWCVAWDEGLLSRAELLAAPVAVGVFNLTGYQLLMHLIDGDHRGLSWMLLVGMGGAFLGSALLLAWTWWSARTAGAGGPPLERSAAGGAAALILSTQGRPAAGGFLREEGPTTGQVLDAATMVLVELSFISLWTGLVMGAIWADHSWGRPWGWDPKEVFALNTFVILLLLVHVRLKVRDKAFWTAILAVVGLEVMLFNWIVVNFIISGLHSYA